MSADDVRWIQRLDSFSRAMAQLTRFIERGNLNEFEKQGLIQAFEYTYELAWNTIKDFYEAQGETGINGSRDAVRLAFRRGLIEDGETWMDMIRSRALTAHTYNEETAESIARAVETIYYGEFVRLHRTLESLKEKTETA